jgi:transcriptional regulator NrdR family protein
MKCPVCGADSRIIKNLANSDNDTFRLRQCRECSNTFYTIEFVIEDTDQFKHEWNKLLAKERNYYRQLSQGRNPKNDPN